MDTLDAIFTRKSVRSFAARAIPDDALRAILLAGMSGPSCVNARDWRFLVVRDRQTLARMAEANGRPAQPLLRAQAGILLLGDRTRAFPPAPDYWVIDGAIAGQNMTLCAQALGIGSVWLGTWPQMDRVQRQAALFALPDSLVPHSILAFGYPEGAADTPVPAPALPASAAAKWEEQCVFWDRFEPEKMQPV